MGDKDEEIGLGEREQASDKDKGKEEREEEGRSPTVTEMNERMKFAPSDVRQWDFRVSRIGGWIFRYPKEDTVTERLAIDTVAQELQKREEPSRLEEGECPQGKKMIRSNLKMYTLDKYGFIYIPDA